MSLLAVEQALGNLPEGSAVPVVPQSYHFQVLSQPQLS